MSKIFKKMLYEDIFMSLNAIMLVFKSRRRIIYSLFKRFIRFVLKLT